MSAFFNYYETTVQRTAYAKLCGQQHIDVCVIGGGLTGVSTALRLAEQGISCSLLEAGRIAGCASGMNGGQIIRGLAPRLAEIEASYGMELSAQFFALAANGMDRVFNNINHYQIACDMRRGGITAAIRPAHYPALQQEAEHLARHYDYPNIELLSPDALAAYVQSPAYHGGLRDPHGGQVNPLAYTLGLAAVAASKGAHLHEYSRVKRMQQRNGLWRIETAEGHIRAERVVIACNAFTGDLERQLAPAVLKVGTYQVATRPLSPEESALLGPEPIFDTHPFNHYFRKSPDNRLLFGCSIGITQNPREADLRHIRKELGKVFPLLIDIEIDYVWGGWMDVTANHLPDIRENHDGRLILQGFNGHGINCTSMAADLAVEKLQGQSTDFDAFARIKHRNIPGLPWTRVPLTLAGHMQYYMSARLSGDRMDFA
jgi:gamma-glutamylputrescine oxidase